MTDYSKSYKKGVATRLEKNPNFYKEIGSKGGKSNKTKFNSERGRAAINARWARKREEEAKKENSTNGQENSQ